MLNKKGPALPRLFAHRGTSILAPENTIAAFDLALHYQCDVLETDVRLSKDGVVMVTHDDTLERTTNGRGKVRSYSCEALKHLDAGYRFTAADSSVQYKQAPLSLLTLDELLKKYPDVGINIDIKDNDPQAAIAVASVIENNDIKNHHRAGNQHGKSARWINVGSFHADVIKRFRQVAPSISTAASRQEVARLVFGLSDRTTQPYQLLQIPVHYWGIRLTGKRLIDKVHARGCEAMYWTINDTKTMRALLEKGADGIVTDRPDLALALFQEMGFKSIN